MKRIDKLIEGIKHMEKSHKFSHGNFIIVNITEIVFNELLIDSQSFSIAELTNKIMTKHPHMTPFSINIKMPFPKN